MSLSSWHFVVLEAPMPASAWLFPLLGVGVVGLAEWWLIRRARRSA